MAERVVSVKMPTSLVSALEEIREQEHYLDLSEQVRSIIRKKALELTNPYTAELNRVRKDLKDGTVTQRAREEVLQELIALLREGNA